MLQSWPQITFNLSLSLIWWIWPLSKSLPLIAFRLKRNRKMRTNLVSKRSQLRMVIFITPNILSPKITLNHFFQSTMVIAALITSGIREVTLRYSNTKLRSKTSSPVINKITDSPRSNIYQSRTNITDRCYKTLIQAINRIFLVVVALKT